MRHFRAPKGWLKVALEDLAEVQTGISKSTSRSVEEPVKVPYLRVANVQDGFVDLTELKEIMIEKHKLSRYKLQPGDVLLTEGGDFDKLGRGCVWAGQVEPCVHQNHVFVVRPDKRKLSPYFLSSQTASPYGRGYFLTCAKQTTNLASINSTQLRQYPVLLPPEEEQKNIESVLRVWDQAISQLGQLLELKERRNLALVQQLLTGRRRFPEFKQSTAIQNTRFGKATADWPIRRFGDFIRESRVLGSHGETARKITIRLYGSGVKPKDDKRRGSASTQYFKRFRGQFIYSKLDFLNGAFGIVPDSMDQYESTLDLPAFDIQEGLDRTFLLAFVTRPIFYTRCVGFAMGGRKARRVPPGQFLSIEFACPSPSEQRRIAEVLKLCDSEIQQIRSQLSFFKHQKKGLMQQLLTGQLRGPVERMGRTHDS